MMQPIWRWPVMACAIPAVPLYFLGVYIGYLLGWGDAATFAGLIGFAVGAGIWRVAVGISYHRDKG